MFFSKNSKNIRMNWSLYACSGHCFIRYKCHAKIQSFFWRVCRIAKRRPLPASCPSVCLFTQNSAFTGRIFVKFDI